MNRSFYYIFFGVISLTALFSCLGDNDNDYYYSPDAELQSFYIKNDSVSTSLDSIKFTIDQEKSLIYNRDSAKYGLVVDDKVIVTFTTASGYNLLHIGAEDSTWIASGDSLDINDIVVLRSYSQTGGYKDYKFQLNIHQVDPDSIIWKKSGDLNFLSDSEENKTFYRETDHSFITVSKENSAILLYEYSLSNLNMPVTTNTGLPSDADIEGMKMIDQEVYLYTASGDFYGTRNNNMATWVQIPVGNDFLVRAIAGGLNEKGDISVIVEYNNMLCFAIYNENTGWTMEDISTDLRTKFPEFPLNNFSSISYRHVNRSKLSVFGGENATVWSTTDGFYWAKLGTLPEGIVGGNVFQYDEKLYLINGRTTTSGAGFDNYDVYTSSDEGINWFLADEKTYIANNSDFVARSRNASVMVDEKNNIYIVAGINNSLGRLKDMWQGKMNKFN